MTDRPILFSGPMVRALLEGRKTQTRRALNPQPYPTVAGFQRVFADLPYFETLGHDGKPLVAGFPKGQDFTTPYPPIKYAIGDWLWVREAWRLPACFDDRSPSTFSPRELVPIQYEADYKRRFWVYDHGDSGRLRASRHMPRWASRLTLIVTDVRVQRVSAISEADAMAEGVERWGVATWKDYQRNGVTHVVPNARDSFRTLWDSLNAKRGLGWDADTWVAAYTFTVHHKNIDLVRVTA